MDMYSEAPGTDNWTTRLNAGPWNNAWCWVWSMFTTIIVSYRGWGTWDFPTPKLQFPPQALPTSAIYLYCFPTSRALCPLPCHIKNHDSVRNTHNEIVPWLTIQKHSIMLTRIQDAFWLHMGLTCTFTCTSYMKVQKVYLLQQSQSLGKSHPVPAQTLPAYKIAKGRATEVPSLEN